MLTTRMALRPGCSWVVLMVKPVSRRSRKRARAPGDAPGIAAPRGRRHDASIQISSRGDAHNYFHDSIRSLNPFSPRSWVPWYRSSPSASSTGSDAVASAPLSPRRHPAQSRSPPWARSRCRRHRIQPPHPARARKRIHRQSGSPFIFPFRNCETPGAPARRLRRLVFSLQPHLPHRPESRARDPRLMHEYLFASIVRYDEPESLGRVEPLHLRSRGAYRRVSPRSETFARDRVSFRFLGIDDPSPPPLPSPRDATTRHRARGQIVRPRRRASVARPSIVVRRRPSSRASAIARATSIAPSRASRVVVSRVPRPPRRRRRASFLSASRAHLPARARRHRARRRVDARRNRDERARASCAARVSVCVSSLLRYSWA